MDLQTLIHHVEVGAGTRRISRWLQLALVAVGVLLLLLMYNLRAFKNMSTQEAMDAAQIARNLAEGNGYTTLFVRPFSLYLIKQKSQRDHAGGTARAADPGCLRGMHPDIANPPVYPVLLAGLMKALPFNFAISRKPKLFWGGGMRFLRYQPDFIISLFNQFLFLVVVASVFFLTCRLFDAAIARLSAVLLLGSELFWRFSVSGISTTLLLLLFVGLTGCLVFLEQEAREPKWKRGGVFLLAGLAGLLVGVGGLTRYSFAWLILPVVGYVIVVSAKQRLALSLTAIVTFAAVLSPWLIRNYSVSGLPFGTASYTVLETSTAFPEDRLQRAIDPGFGSSGPTSHRVASAFWHAFWQKLIGNGRQIVRTDLPKLGGTWLSAFFLVGLFIQFRNPAVRRLRYFLLACLVLLSVVQAVGHTQLSEDSPEINSENLLILVAPLVLVYGVSLFQLLLEQVQLPFPELRYLVIGLFGAVACLPLLLTFLPPRTSTLAYPPYYPPSIQTAAGWATDEELTMSDIPWAVAWYGQTQCIWLTLNSYSDYFAINDYQKPVSALYLTPRTFESWSRTVGWGSICVQCLVQLPKDDKYPAHLNLTLPQPGGASTAFPLSYLQAGWPMQLLLTYRPHWPKPS
jgi:4-amino-4-deoxy-L-arabinose transferase-like glycosyltransferase